jgi:hypothetical protein
MKNTNKIIILHLSVILGAFLPLPFGSFIVPYIFWSINKKYEGKEFEIQARNLLNFQLLFNTIIILCLIVFWYQNILDIVRGGVMNFSKLKYFALFIILINMFYPIFVSLSIKLSGKLFKYYPKTIHIL